MDESSLPMSFDYMGWVIVQDTGSTSSPFVGVP